MSELFTLLQEPWAVRALFSSMMVGIMCGLLGCYIVLRNMSLIGDALAHAILPGVVFAFMLVGYNLLGFFVGSVMAGLFTAVSITWIQHNAKTKNDAAIGIVFTAMFSIGVIAISWITHNQGVHLDLKDFLFGNVLGVRNEDLLLTNVVNILVIISIIIFYRYLFATTFQPVLAETMGISVKAVHYLLMVLLSFAVVASLQTVGVILVVAMLITPASTALLLTQKMRTALIISALIGMASAFFGLVLAIIFETTPGPAMAVTATIFYLLALIFAPKKGLIVRQLNKVKLRSKILFEDTLKQSFKLHEINQLSREALKNKLGFTSATFDKQLRLLRGRKLLLEDSTGLKLTDLGITKANELVRAHRLWETYLVNELGLNSYQIHEDAENYEHLLTKELLKEMDQRLGYPSLDPHGSPIPPDESRPVLSLLSLNKSQTARLSVQQASESIRAQLWGLGLLPGMEITIMDEGEESIKIEAENKVLDISRSFAGNINVSLN